MGERFCPNARSCKFHQIAYGLSDYAYTKKPIKYDKNKFSCEAITEFLENIEVCPGLSNPTAKLLKNNVLECVVLDGLNNDSLNPPQKP